MALSNELISLFAKATNDKETSKKEATVNATVVNYNGAKYVKIDGSELLTPVSSTTDMEDGERVTVMIKNHTATVTGNLSSPAARTDTVKDLSDEISEFEIVIADKVSTEELEAEKGRINDLITDNVLVKETLTANSADISDLQADNVFVKETITANSADIETIKTEKLDAKTANITYATIENLKATNQTVYNLNATYGVFEDLTTRNFEAVNANITELNTKKLDAESAEITYANIDFSNIKMAAVEELFTKSGIIKNLVVGDTSITGELVGVTIKGDLIEGNTIKAEKLVVKGSDGLYYKLNVDAGVVASEEVTEEELQNGLHGDTIIAHTITAEKINVHDLVAFDATIGGFKITENSIYSGAKISVNNTTRGLYLDKEGQFAVGDSTNYLKYFKDTDGKYKLVIAADSILLKSGKSVEETINNIQVGGRNLIRNSKTLIFDRYKFSRLIDAATVDSAQIDYSTIQ